MKKQLITGAMLLTMMVGSATSAMAAEPALNAVKMKVETISTNYKNMVPLNGATTPKLNDVRTLTADEYAAQLEDTKVYLKELVAKGELTQTEVNTILANMETMLQDIKDGKKDIKVGTIIGDNGEKLQVSFSPAMATTSARPAK